MNLIKAVFFLSLVFGSNMVHAQNSSSSNDLRPIICNNFRNAQMMAESNYNTIKTGACELQLSVLNTITKEILKNVCSEKDNLRIQESMRTLQSRSNDDEGAGLNNNQRIMLTHLIVTAIATATPESFQAGLQSNGCL